MHYLVRSCKILAMSLQGEHFCSTQDVLIEKKGFQVGDQKQKNSSLAPWERLIELCSKTIVTISAAISCLLSSFPE